MIWIDWNSFVTCPLYCQLDEAMGLPPSANAENAIDDINEFGTECVNQAVSAAVAIPFSSEKSALVDMAKRDKKVGLLKRDMDAYEELNRGLPDPFPEVKVRTDPGHAGRSPSSQVPHGHVGPVGHIPINDPWNAK